MGIYDQLLPSNGQYISTYAGAPIEETAALGEVIGQRYDKGMEGISAYNVMRNNVQVSGKDQDLKDKIFDESYEGLQKYAERGDYENAIPAIMNATAMVTGSRDLKKAMSNQKALSAHAELADKLLADQKITKFQYDNMQKNMSEYDGVEKSNNINDFLHIPSKPINMYDKFVAAGESVGTSKGVTKRVYDPVTKKMVDIVKEQRNVDDVNAALESALANDPEMQSYYNDLVMAYGEEDAKAMVQRDMQAAGEAVTNVKYDNKYQSIDDSDSTDTPKGKLVQFSKTISQTMNINDYNELSENYQATKSLYDQRKAVLDASDNPPQALIDEVAQLEKQVNATELRIGGVIDEYKSGYSHEEDYAKFQKTGNAEELFEEAGIPYPKTLAEYTKLIEDYAKGNVPSAIDEATGREIIPTAGAKERIEGFLTGQARGLKDYVTGQIEDAPPRSAEGYVLASDAGGYIDKVNTLLKKTLTQGGLGQFTTYNGDVQVSAALEGIEIVPNSEQISMTTVYDDNGNNVYQLSYINKETGQREGMLIKSGEPILNQDASSKVIKSMNDIITNPNATVQERAIATNYLKEAVWTPALRRADVYSGGEVKMTKPGGGAMTLPMDYANPSKKGNIGISIKLDNKTGIYTLTLTDSENPDDEPEVTTYTKDNGVAEISQYLTNLNNTLLQDH